MNEKETVGGFVVRLSRTKPEDATEEDKKTMEKLLKELQNFGADISDYIALGDIQAIAKQMVKEVTEFLTSEVSE